MLTPIPEMSGFPSPHSAPQTCLRHGVSCVKLPWVAIMSRPTYAAKSLRTSKAAQYNVVVIGLCWYLCSGGLVKADIQWTKLIGGHIVQNSAEHVHGMPICSVSEAEHFDQAVELVSLQRRLITMVAAPHTAEHAYGACWCQLSLRSGPHQAEVCHS